MRIGPACCSVEVQDERDRLMGHLWHQCRGRSSGSELKAPDAGMVLNLLMEPRAEVAKGDP